MKKNKLIRVAIIVLALTLLTTCLLSGTFAKYSTTIEGNGSATAAEFDFNGNGTTAWTFENLGHGDTIFAPEDTGTITLAVKLKTGVDSNVTATVATTDSTGVFADLTTEIVAADAGTGAAAITTADFIKFTLACNDSVTLTTTTANLSTIGGAIQAALEEALGADTGTKVIAAGASIDRIITIEWTCGTGSDVADTIIGKKIADNKAEATSIAALLKLSISATVAQVVAAP